MAASNGTTKLALLTSQHGDITGAYDVNASTATARADYSPFGVKSNTSGFFGNLGFQGSWNNPNSSVQRTNMWHRWYTPGTGSFIARDSYDVPVKGSVDANRFLYGSANPLAYTDPTGGFAFAVLLAPVAVLTLPQVALVVGGAVAVVAAVQVADMAWDAVNSRTSSRDDVASTSEVNTVADAATGTAAASSAGGGGGGCQGPNCDQGCKTNCAKPGDAAKQIAKDVAKKVKRVVSRVKDELPDWEGADDVGKGETYKGEIQEVGSTTTDKATLSEATENANCTQGACSEVVNALEGVMDLARGNPFSKLNPSKAARKSMNEAVKLAKEARRDAAIESQKKNWQRGDDIWSKTSKDRDPAWSTGEISLLEKFFKGHET